MLGKILKFVRHTFGRSRPRHAVSNIVFFILMPIHTMLVVLFINYGNKFINIVLFDKFVYFLEKNTNIRHSAWMISDVSGVYQKVIPYIFAVSVLSSILVFIIPFFYETSKVDSKFIKFIGVSVISNILVLFTLFSPINHSKHSVTIGYFLGNTDIGMVVQSWMLPTLALLNGSVICALLVALLRRLGVKH